ncbi:MAG TPA: PEP-CTERM sorting domain-containing protein, partial [Rubrivivax sp.]|nr:PEP-CTERM sorting domain-containing protein [Rubrivivax sp.]
AGGPGGPGGSRGAPSAGPVGRSPSYTNPGLPGSEVGSGRRPGGAGFPFDPGPLVLSPPSPVLVVPEPGTWALWMLGLAALAGAVRRSARVSS